MRTGIKVVLLLCMVLILSCAKEHLVVLTEEFPPFNFTKDGEVAGLSTEVVKAILTEAGVSYEVQVHSWKESYETAMNTKNCILFSTSRRPDREELFKWVGTIAPTNYSVFILAEREDIEILALEEMEKYKIGITPGDARSSFFKSKGFEIGEQLIVSENNKANFEKLMNKEIDLWPMPNVTASYIVKEAGFKPEEVINGIFVLEELTKGGYYLAINNNTSDAVVKKLQAALDKIKEDGTYDKILKKWGV